MKEDDIRKELIRIAVSEIGKKNVTSASVRQDVDFDGTEALEILVTLTPDAPSVSGATYASVLLMSRDFLYALGDKRRPSLALDRVPRASVTPAK